MERRAFVRTCGVCGLSAALARALPGQEAHGVHPPLDSPEGGLWALCDREEERLRKNPLRLRDPELTAYVQGVACRLAQDRCPEVRTYVLRTPYFNANMAPNGMMQVWTGLLLRCRNEAQLAAILGHEIGHYVLRHALEQLKDAKSRSAFSTLMLVIPVAGPLVALGAMAGGFKYSRDHERAADRIGLELMAKAGYPPIEASKVWANLLEELKAEQDWSGDAGKRSFFFATHPPEAERRKTLEDLAAAIGGNAQDPGTAPLRKAIAPWRMAWLEDELKRHRLGESLALMTRLGEADPQDGMVRYFLGETYRLRGAEGDAALAAAAYAQAADLPGAPPEVYRALGRMHRKAGRTEEMKQAYARYLQLRPDAEDADMVRSYLKEP